MTREPRFELARLAGEVLCVGVPGVLDAATLTRMRDLRPGGIVLFARNVPDVPAAAATVASLRDALADELPLSVCVDQEGGRVARIPLDPPLPAALALGASDDVALAERAGTALAAAVRSVGGNVDFAPVLDLALEPGSTLLGTRALGDDPARVAPLGAALVRGLQAAGVAATVKHFPGHGATTADSHVAAATVATDAATLRSREFVPFGAAFAAGARAVMTAHVRVPALDPDRPATLSRRVLHDVLRVELGFGGACFTDCLEMAAVADPYGVAGAGVLALQAGADALLVSHDLAGATALRDALVAAVTDGTLPLARLEEAVARLRALRAAHPAPSSADGAVVVAREIAQRAIVRVRGELVLARDVPVTVVSFEGATSDGVAATETRRPSLSSALRRRGRRSESLRVALEPDAEMCDQLVALLSMQTVVGPRALVLLARRAHLYTAQRRAIDALLNAHPEALLVSMLEPFDLACFRQARRVASALGDTATNVDALADVLTGAVPATGRLPVTLERGTVAAW